MLILSLCYGVASILLLGLLSWLPAAHGAGMLAWVLLATCVTVHAPALALQTLVTQLDAMTLEDLLGEDAGADGARGGSGGGGGGGGAGGGGGGGRPKGLGLSTGPTRVNVAGLAARELSSLKAIAPPLLRSALTSLVAYAPLGLLAPMRFLRALGALLMLAVSLSTLAAVVAVPLLHVYLRKPPPPPPPPPPKAPATGAARRALLEPGEEGGTAAVEGGAGRGLGHAATAVADGVSRLLRRLGMRVGRAAAAGGGGHGGGHGEGGGLGPADRGGYGSCGSTGAFRSGGPGGQQHGTQHGTQQLLPGCVGGDPRGAGRSSCLASWTEAGAV